MSLTKLGIGDQAQAVLALLEGYAGIDPHYIQVAPWHNGRERGLCFYLDDYTVSQKRMCIAVFEHRNSDDLCALKWEESTDNNPPSCTTETIDRAYKGGTKHDVDHCVSWGEIGKMTMWIRRQFLLATTEETINETK